MKTEPDWRDVLLKAASIVEEGWCQGSLYQRKDGTSTGDREEAVQLCAIGAISAAWWRLSGADSAQHDASVISAAQMGLYEHLGHPIAKWNDHPDRTALEVAEAMRQAASSPRP